jgi:ATP-binding cassette subfamily B protein
VSGWPDEHDDMHEDQLSYGLCVGLWRKLFAYTRPYRRDVALMAVFALIAAGADVMLPLFTRTVIDKINTHGMAANLHGDAVWYLVLTLILGLSISGFIRAGGKLRVYISHDIRRDGFENLQRLPFAFYDYRPVGWLMARMTSDCDRLATILAWGMLDLIWGSTLMGGIAIAMLIMHAKLALIVLAMVPVLLGVSAFFRWRILHSARLVRQANSRLTGAYNENIMGILTTKSFAREESNLDDFKTLSGTMYAVSTRNLIQAAVYLPLILALASLATGLALAIGGIHLTQGVISIGTLITFLAYIRYFFAPVEELGHWFAEMQMAQAAAERILSLIEAQPDIADSAAVRANLNKAASAASAAAPGSAADGGQVRIRSIDLVDVHFTYDTGKPILHDINLSVRAGETIAIVGPTGSGKSTLVNVICRFYEPTSGQILIDGVDYRHRSLHWLQSNLGVVLQQPHVFSGTILENIRYGRLEASVAEVEAAAKLAGAHEFIMAMERGYLSEAGASGNRLSGGQKQMISFARAILADPQILVMDEATASVDTETEQHIQQGLANVIRGRMAFIIAHRLSTIKRADRIIVLRDGTVEACGTHAELMAQRGHYFELYRQQRLVAQPQERLTASSPAPPSADGADPARRCCAKRGPAGRRCARPHASPPGH